MRPPRRPHEHSEHQRVGNVSRFKLAVVDLPECRQLQHDRLQERRNRFLVPGRPDRQRRPGLRRRRDEPGFAQFASGQRRLDFDDDRPRHPGLGLLCRVQLERRALPHPQRLVHARRLRQPRQQRRLLPDGRERSERRFAACGEFADRTREGQCQRRRPDRDGDDRRLAHRQSALDGDAGRRRRSAIGQYRELDLYRSDLARGLRQSRRRAHDQCLFHQHRPKHLGSRRLRRGGCVGQRRLSLFVRSARDPDAYLQSDDRRAAPPARRFRLRCRTGRRCRSI